MTARGIIEGYAEGPNRELHMIGPEMDAKTYAVTMLKALSRVIDGDTVEPTYNGYDARKVGRWALKVEGMFPGTKFIPGLELSVVLYVKADASVMAAIYKAAGRQGADERDLYTGPSYSSQHLMPSDLAGMTEPVYLRLWWD